MTDDIPDAVKVPTDPVALTPVGDAPPPAIISVVVPNPVVPASPVTEILTKIAKLTSPRAVVPASPVTLAVASADVVTLPKPVVPVKLVTVSPQVSVSQAPEPYPPR